MNIFLGILMSSMFCPESVNDWECWDALGGILHPTVLIPFTQLIFVLLWIIETPCGTAAEMATVRHWRGFKDVPLKLFQK